MKPGDVAYYEMGDAQMTVVIHDIVDGIAYVSEVGDDDDEVFEVDLAQLSGPV